jgi:alkylation response protein AidB-like acyl-CoA dehydrogenase
VNKGTLFPVLFIFPSVFLQADLGMEIHVLSSAAKPLAAWIARDAIQDCREACGGHGYLKGTVSFLH